MVTAWQREVLQVHVAPAVCRYITEIVRATRQHPDVLLGSSPRGSLALMKASQALAFLTGQTYVDPQLVKRVAVPVLAHRLILAPQAQGQTDIGVVQAILGEVPVPVCGD
jgi:MoxR-like ATPase